MKYLDKAVNLLLKLRRKTHNTLAIIVVTAGIALVAQKIWGPILASLLQNYDIDVPDLRTEPYGVFLILSGLFYHYIYSKSKTGEFRLGKSDIVDHDSKLLSQFRAIVDYEQVREYFYELSNDHSYHARDSRAVRQGVRFLVATENQFLSSKLNIPVEKLLKSKSDLLNFVAYSFFVYPDIRENSGENLRLCMFPDLNLDRGGSGDDAEHVLYSKKAQELDALLEIVISDLDSFIEVTKSELGSRAL